MKWWLKGWAFLLILALAFLAPRLWVQLPVTSEGRVAESYAEWAGVLRVWVYTGWTPGSGSFTAWLNACAARFEKSHSGVYVQIQPVSEATARDFAESANPPDALLIAPGVLHSTSGLLVLPETDALWPGLRESGLQGEAFYARPVAMGGYAWALNTAYISEVPLDWRQLAEQPSLRERTEGYWMQVSRDAPYVNWSAALLSLCADRTVSEAGETTPRVGEGIDLGLPEAEATAEPEPARVVQVDCALPLLLPENFRTSDGAYSDFIAARVAVTPVTQWEIRKLQLLSESGRGPDWKVEAVGENFTDQLALFAIADVPRRHLEERQALCLQLLDCLLSEESQQGLTIARALRVTDGPALYAAQRGMAELEAAYRLALRVPNAFDADWRAIAQRQADALAAE